MIITYQYIYIYIYIKYLRNWNAECIEACLPKKYIVLDISFSFCITFELMLELGTVFMDCSWTVHGLFMDCFRLDFYLSNVSVF